jgi:hypothetical protein
LTPDEDSSGDSGNKDNTEDKEALADENMPIVAEIDLILSVYVVGDGRYGN